MLGKNSKPVALIINGAEVRKPQAAGELNTLLFETLRRELSAMYNVATTVTADGYDTAAEQHKFKQADLIIFQFPVFWFDLPSSLKRYIDDIYAHGVFFGPTKQYGRGGLLTGKHYMVSTTWNAKSSDFNTDSGFLGKRTPDNILTAFHLTQQYIGLSPLPSFSEHDVVHNPDATGAIRRLQEHLRGHLASN